MIKKMKAAVMYEIGDLRIEEVPVPVPGRDDVLVKIAACGICGSDVQRVLTKGAYHYPIIPGHEISGVIVETGKNINDSILGQRVSIIPLLPCRRCSFCEVGKYAQCENYGFIGSRDNGGFAEYVKVPLSNTVNVPEKIDDEAAALLEPVSVALHLVQNIGLKYGEDVAVFGLGSIGNLIAQWAKAFGAKHVFAIDVIPEKVRIAKSIGLDDAMIGENKEVINLVMEKTGNVGVDVAIEASGSKSAFTQAVNLLRTEGRLGLIGRPEGGVLIEEHIYEKILRGQIDISGTWSFEFTGFPHHAWYTCIDAMKMKNIMTAPLITHRFKIYEAFNAIKMINEKKIFTNKVLIKPD